MTRVRLLVLAVVALSATACGNTPIGQLDSTGTTTAARPAADSNTLVLDKDAVEEGVTKILRERYAEEATDVRCPANQPVKKGHTFDCTLKVAGDSRHVTITVRSDERAEYEVSQSK